MDTTEPEIEPQIKPLPYKQRRGTFVLLLMLFVGILPFLYLYASGFRFDFNDPEVGFVETGGMYIAAERTGAEIYIDNDLVRETRVFRKAFYAQGLPPGTHRVHVQSSGSHTWVKELPVSPGLVSEAQAFNLPLMPLVRVVSPLQSATGTTIVTTPLVVASTTNQVRATTTTKIAQFVQSTEYQILRDLFVPATTTAAEDTLTERVTSRVTDTIDGILATTTSATTTVTEVATTTKIARDIKLYEKNGEVLVEWIGSREDMPYYYCAPDFDSYVASTTTPDLPIKNAASASAAVEPDVILHPVQSVAEDIACIPVITMDRKGQLVTDFDFFPGSTDLVLLSLEDGVYVAEVDNRGWQNTQPLVSGLNLEARVENGQVYVYDGSLIYQVILES